MDARALLKHALATSGMTTLAAADMCNVSRRTVQNWLAGKTPVPELALLVILNASTPQATPRQVLDRVANDNRRAIAALQAALAAEQQALQVVQQQLNLLEDKS